MNDDLTKELENYYIKKNIPIQKTEIIYENKYDKYVENTEKLWKTENQNLIQNLEHENKVIGRKFLIDDKIGYIEIFEDKKFNILGLSKK